MPTCEIISGCRTVHHSKSPSVQSKPYRQSRATSAINNTLRRHPFVTFGLPFITIMVVASFGMSTFTQTKYDRADGKVKEVSCAGVINHTLNTNAHTAR